MLDPPSLAELRRTSRTPQCASARKADVASPRRTSGKSIRNTQHKSASTAHRTPTDWPRAQGASITRSLAAGGGRSLITTNATTGGHEARTP